MKPKLKRILIGFPEPQLEKIDHLIEQGVYPDRNEAVRTGVRELLQKHETGLCTA